MCNSNKIYFAGSIILLPPRRLPARDPYASRTCVCVCVYAYVYAVPPCLAAEVRVSANARLEPAGRRSFTRNWNQRYGLIRSLRTALCTTTATGTSLLACLSRGINLSFFHDTLSCPRLAALKEKATKLFLSPCANRTIYNSKVNQISRRIVSATNLD